VRKVLENEFNVKSNRKNHSSMSNLDWVDLDSLNAFYVKNSFPDHVAPYNTLEQSECMERNDMFRITEVNNKVNKQIQLN